MRHIERILIDLDGGVWSAVSRITLGLAIVPAFRIVCGGSDRGWTFVGLFVALLIALRVVPAVARHVLEFSAEAKAIWAERRNIAKQHDCYQWQKLFWIGLGFVPYATAGGGLRGGELVVAATCLIGGGAGLLLWHRRSGLFRPGKRAQAGPNHACGMAVRS